MTFGEAMRLVRKKKKLTQRDLAQRTDFSLDSISRWERGERSPTVSDLKKIADALDTSVAFLMGETDEPTASEPKTLPNPAVRQESSRMFERLIKKMATYSPDIVLHFRDLDNVIDQFEPEDVQALADAYATITGIATKGYEGRMRKKSRHGDL